MAAELLSMSPPHNGVFSVWMQLFLSRDGQICGKFRGRGQVHLCSSHVKVQYEHERGITVNVQNENLITMYSRYIKRKSCHSFIAFENPRIQL